MLAPRKRHTFILSRPTHQPRSDLPQMIVRQGLTTLPDTGEGNNPLRCAWCSATYAALLKFAP